MTAAVATAVKDRGTLGLKKGTGIDGTGAGAKAGQSREERKGAVGALWFGILGPDPPKQLGLKRDAAFP